MSRGFKIILFVAVLVLLTIFVLYAWYAPNDGNQSQELFECGFLSGGTINVSDQHQPPLYHATNTLIPFLKRDFKQCEVYNYKYWK